MIVVVAALIACGGGAAGPSTEDVARLTIALHAPVASPSDDPMIGADTIAITVRTADGDDVATASIAVDQPLILPDIGVFGVLDVEVVALSGGAITAAGRSGPIVVAPGDSPTIDVLFLPVNKAVALDFTLSSGRTNHSSFAAADGRVLVVGGRVPGGSVLATSEWFDPVDGFAAGPIALAGPRLNLTSAPFGDRGVVFAGGESAIGTGHDQADVVILDASGAEQGAVPPMTDARSGFCLAAFLPTSLFAAGGRADPDNAVEILRPGVDGAAPVWAHYTMANHDASDIGSCAGTGTGYVVTTSRSGAGWGVFDLAAPGIVDVEQRFQQAAGGPFALDGAMMIPTGGDEVLVLGGTDGVTARADAHRFDARARRVSADDAISLVHGRAFAQWRWWDEGSVIAVALGTDENGADVMSLELVDSGTGPILDVALPSPLRGSRMDVIPGGVVLFSGGSSNDGVYAVVPWLP